ncbi:MAG: PSD1 and planctomycete cytochrome C domain-containing protein [Fimbriiglobus sp.]|nr:PSD1 and planctomycete cytochrome C domain-containing protein [Fimbriiglobus sp.]
MNRLFPLAVVLTLAPFARAADIDFNRDVRPILSNNCFACHGPDDKERKGKLRLDTFDGATKNGSLVPGKPDESEFIARVVSTDENDVMPPAKTGKKLTAKEVETLKAWVKQGGRYATHWSYVKPARPAVPTVPLPTRNPIDQFILARLKQEGLAPSPEADKTTLVRRVALDLTGLPPTLDEVDRFLKDTAPDAYEHMVDRLLAKPAFGEHWARMWLDLARYADSAGYADDPLRTIWPYRDYVIRSLNANKKFDRFTVEQIAGDLLPDATDETRTATAFHRNTMTNSEGGTSDEEFRNVAVVDRVNTTLAVWMGTSAACAQCHTHKYDPISQVEYFKLFAFLNNTEDADRSDESPVLPLDDTPEKRATRAEYEKAVAALRGVKVVDKDDAAEVKKLTDRLTGKLNALRPKVTVPVMKELPQDKRRVTKLQFRGNFMDLGEAVTEGTPAALHPFPKGEPLNRLGFARWIVSPDNPLTARVTVNRFWEQVFGNGLVRTTEEFGTQGELPSHPELLDWLAVEFASDWDVKRLLKLMVASAAYRQTSRVTPELREKDPDNRLYARGPRYRLSAEMVRDQALAVSGLLSAKVYGPSVRPPRPSMGLSAAFGGGLDWKTSDGEDRHRRGLYTEWRRTSPYPSMITFDAPSREACTLRRIRTNTPLQALVTLNDPVYVEAAQALARKVAAHGTTTDERVVFAFRTCTSREPTAKERTRLVKLFEEAKAEYVKDAKKAEAMATDPIGPLPKGANAAELAAWTTVGNVLLNLDEMLMRR